MTDEPRYDDWLARRRAVEPSVEMTDRIIAAVEEQQQPTRHYVQLADRMNTVQPIRWAACLSALVVGTLPFFYVTYAAQLLVY